MLGILSIDPLMANDLASNRRPLTMLEAVLQSKRTPVAVLILAPLVAWTWIVVMAHDMYGSMRGASAWMMTATWDIPHLLLLWAMWAVMMVGMMLPSASPMLLLYSAMVRGSTPGSPARQTYMLAAGYLIVWGVFSLGATALQRVLAAHLVVSPMMEVTSPAVGATLLFIAGVYQMTPLKLTCLRKCQSPFGFLMSRWRTGIRGAITLGLEHGAYCVGCCWALMLLLFVGGVMNVIVIAALTVFVALEKLAPFGRQSARISGLLLIAVSAWLLVR